MNIFTVLLRINAGGVHLIFDIFWGGGAFIRGRRFLEVGRLFEALRYANFCLYCVNFINMKWLNCGMYGQLC